MFAGDPADAHDVAVDPHLYAFIGKQLVQSVRYVLVFAMRQAVALFHDGHATAEPA